MENIEQQAKEDGEGAGAVGAGALGGGGGAIVENQGAGMAEGGHLGLQFQKLLFCGL